LASIAFSCVGQKTACQSGEGLADSFPPVLHPQPLAQTPRASFEPRGFPPDLTTAHQGVAHARLGFSGSMPYPRRAFTPSKVLSDWLPSPCDAALPSPRRGVTPATTTEPMPCGARSPEARSAATQRWGGRAQQFPRSRIVPQTDRLRWLSSPFGAAAPSGPGFAPLAEGIEPSRLDAFPGRLPPEYWTLMASQSLSPSSAVERPQLRLI
jgi:hypothetical protein